MSAGMPLTRRPGPRSEAEHHLQQQFKADVRNVGIHAASDRMEADNARKRASVKRTYENNKAAHLLDKYGRPTITPAARRHGRYYTAVDCKIDGVRGVYSAEYLDGELVAEEFKPMEESNG